MLGIFSRLGLMAMLMMLAACGAKGPEIIKPPKDVAATVEPFLAALRSGKKTDAQKYVLAGATDELEAQFAADHVRLARGPALKPRMIEKRDRGANKDVIIVYAGRQNGKWTSATVRVARSNPNDRYRVEYWRVSNNPPSLATGSAVLKETAAMNRNARLIFWSIIALLAGICVALFIWAIRNRTQPDAISDGEERRPVASTTRD